MFLAFALHGRDKAVQRLLGNMHERPRRQQLPDNLIHCVKRARGRGGWIRLYVARCSWLGRRAAHGRGAEAHWTGVGQ